MGPTPPADYQWVGQDLKNTTGQTSWECQYTVLLASVLAAKGDLDGATETAQQVRAAATTIKSTRLDERLNEFAARLTPHRAAPVIASYLRDVGLRSSRTRRNPARSA
jgi:hypothetical protein